jgi:autotransporter-associated beta strand protein
VNPTGTVSFSEGSSPLGTGTLSTTGGVTTATLNISTLGLGSHTITFSYSGDSNFTGSSGTLAQTVVSPPTGAITFQAKSTSLSALSNWPGGLLPALNGTVDLIFSSSAITNPVNDFPAGSSFRSLVFSVNQSFNFTGAPISLVAGIDASQSSASINVGVDLTLLGSQTFTVGQAARLGVSGVMSGSGGLTKQGSGELTITSASTYSGATTVSGGKLMINGSLQNSPTMVNNGGTLGGLGSVPTITANGGDVAPGNDSGQGTLTSMGKVTLGGGSNLDIQLLPQSSSVLNSPTVDLESANLKLMMPMTFVPALNTKFPFMTGSTLINGTLTTFSGLPNQHFLPVNAQLFKIDYSTADAFVTRTTTSADTMSVVLGPTVTPGVSITFSWTIMPIAVVVTDGTIDYQNPKVHLFIDKTDVQDITLPIGGETIDPVSGNESGTFTMVVQNLSPGNHTFKSHYDGNTNYEQSSTDNGGSFTVNAGTAVTLSSSSSNNTSFVGVPVTFTASVVGVPSTAGTPTGSVQFVIDGSKFGSPVSLSNGVATSQPNSTLSAGNHTVTASYLGDGTFVPTSGTLAGGLTVANPTPTATTVTSSGSTSVFGQAVVFTASLGPNTADGTVKFIIDGTDYGNASIINGNAVTADITNLSVGTHTVTASYLGDAMFAPSTGTLSGGQTVQPASTSTVLSSSLNSAPAGRSVTFTATISMLFPSSNPPANPTGTVLFFDGSTNIGQMSVASTSGVSTAAFSTSTLTVGTHSITASYSGDGNFTASSGGLPQTVVKIGTTTTVTSSGSSSVFGQAVRFTASVSPSAAAGSVQFVIDGTDYGSVSVSNGLALSNNITSLSVGAHTVTASYLGDSTYASSTGTLTGGQTVQPASTSLVLSSSLNPSTAGQSVTFTATISALFPSSNPPANPGGTVLFFDGSTNIGQMPVSTTGGVTTATLSTSTLAVGTHSITASYSGDGNYLVSLSNSIPEMVKATALADGTILVSSFTMSGQSTTGGIIGIDPNTFGQSAVGGNLTLPVTIREGSGPNPMLYVLDYSAMGTGAVIVIDPSTGQQSTVYTGGEINGPVAMAIDTVNNMLYVLNVGTGVPVLVKLDLSNNGTQTPVATYSADTFANPVSLAFDPSNQMLYLADEGTAPPPDVGGPRLGTIYTVDSQGNLNALPSPNNMLDHIEDLGVDGNGNLVAFVAGSGIESGNLIQVDPSTGNQSALVTGLYSGTNLILDGGTVDVKHSGTIYVSAYDPTGALPSEVDSIDPMTYAVSTVTTGGSLGGVLGGLVVFNTAGGGAAAAPPAHSGLVLRGSVTAVVHAVQPARGDSSSAGPSLTSPPITIPAQHPVMLQAVAAAFSTVAVPRAATDSLFAIWDESFLPEAFAADPLLAGMASGLST